MGRIGSALQSLYDRDDASNETEPDDQVIHPPQPESSDAVAADDQVFPDLEEPIDDNEVSADSSAESENVPIDEVSVIQVVSDPDPKEDDVADELHEAPSHEAPSHVAPSHEDAEHEDAEHDLNGDGAAPTDDDTNTEDGVEPVAIETPAADVVPDELTVEEASQLEFGADEAPVESIHSTDEHQAEAPIPEDESQGDDQGGEIEYVQRFFEEVLGVASEDMPEETEEGDVWEGLVAETKNLDQESNHEDERMAPWTLRRIEPLRPTRTNSNRWLLTISSPLKRKT